MEKKKTRKFKSNKMCCVKGCSNHTVANSVSLHKLPKEANLRKKWEQALKMVDYIPKNAAVCSEHFQEGDFMKTRPPFFRRRLRPDAVPSSNIPESCVSSKTSQDSVLTENRVTRDKRQENSVLVKHTDTSCQQTMMGKQVCAVIGCVPDVIVYPFPPHLSKAKLWIDRCGNMELYALPIEKLFISFGVCRSHFSREQYQDDSCSSLVDWSIPDVSLPVLSDSESDDEPLQVIKLDRAASLMRFVGMPDDEQKGESDTPAQRHGDSMARRVVTSRLDAADAPKAADVCKSGTQPERTVSVLKRGREVPFSKSEHSSGVPACEDRSLECCVAAESVDGPKSAIPPAESDSRCSGGDSPCGVLPIAEGTSSPPSPAGDTKDSFEDVFNLRLSPLLQSPEFLLHDEAYWKEVIF
ncbi:uncharacterized protein LOC124170288 [Ischnura elegans]|uniref:uncharacterized protein LOC124170288 n=1 Tax=Ischnura elegans TaxID=197161 RepID=UPI001ED87A19|nr:uncharacterized protein LOC124170288 [Ischnura elegans]